jgi:putative addiction module antidote
MKTSLVVRRIGNSLGVILGKEALSELGVTEGDTLFVVRTPDGISLTAYDPDFADAIEAGRAYMRRHRNALRELAR